MAKKIEFNDKPAYEEDGKIILQLDEETNKWMIYHKKTGFPIMGPGVNFKQKKEAVIYAQALIELFDLDFSSKEEMFDINGGEQNCMRLRTIAWERTLK